MLYQNDQNKAIEFKNIMQDSVCSLTCDIILPSAFEMDDDERDDLLVRLSAITE